jgi:hypothetical protein
MKCCRVFRDGFPRQSTTYRGFLLYIAFREGEHAIPRWGLKKHAHDPRYAVENRGKCKKKKQVVPSVDYKETQNIYVLLRVYLNFIIGDLRHHCYNISR